MNTPKIKLPLRNGVAETEAVMDANGIRIGRASTAEDAIDISNAVNSLTSFTQTSLTEQRLRAHLSRLVADWKLSTIELEEGVLADSNSVAINTRKALTDELERTVQNN